MQNLRPESDFHARALNHVQQVFTAAKEQRLPREKVWTALNDAFIGYERSARLETNEYRGDVIYLIYHFVETVAAFIVDNMLPERDFGAMQARGDEDKAQEAPINKLLQWRFDKAQVRNKLIHMVVRGLIYGVSAAKLSWTEKMVHTMENQPQIDPETGLNKDSYALVSHLAYSGPGLTPKGPWDIWYDQFMTDPDEAWVIDVDRMTLGDIRAMTENSGWKNVKLFEDKVTGAFDPDQAKNIIENSDNDDTMKYDVTQGMPGVWQSTSSRSIVGKNRFKVYEYSGPFDYFNNGTYIPCLIDWSEEHGIVFRVEPAPFIHGQQPWIFCRPMPWLEEFCGISMAGVNLAKQDYLNDIFKLMMDNWERAVNQIGFRDHRTKIDADAIRFQAFKIYNVQTPPGVPFTQAINFPTVPDIKGSSLAILNEVMGIAKVESSVEDFFSTGQTRGVTKTASGISQITERAGSRHKFKLTIIEDQTIKRIGYQFFALDQQYARDEDVQPVLNGPMPRLSIESVLRMWDFYPIGSEAFTRKQKDKDNIAFAFQSYVSAAPIITQQGFIIDWKAITDAFWKAIDMPELQGSIQVAPPQPVPGGPPQPGELPPGQPQPNGGGNGAIPPEMMAQMGGMQGRQ